MKVTFTKLKNGRWGLRVALAPNELVTTGQAVMAIRKDGSTERKTLGALVWQGPDGATGNKVALYELANNAPKGRSSWRPCGYPGCAPSFCDECDGEGMGGNYRGEGA
jgi:hypothetical protein